MTTQAHPTSSTNANYGTAASPKLGNLKQSAWGRFWTWISSVRSDFRETGATIKEMQKDFKAGKISDVAQKIVM